MVEEHSKTVQSIRTLFERNYEELCLYGLYSICQWVGKRNKLHLARCPPFVGTSCTPFYIVIAIRLQLLNRFVLDLTYTVRVMAK